MLRWVNLTLSHGLLTGIPRHPSTSHLFGPGGHLIQYIPWTGKPNSASMSTNLHTLGLRQLAVNAGPGPVSQVSVLRPTSHLPERGSSSVPELNLLWVASHLRTTNATSSTTVESMVVPWCFKQLVKTFSNHKAHKVFQQWSESSEDQGRSLLAITFNF